jgi:hypothetical protein
MVSHHQTRSKRGVEKTENGKSKASKATVADSPTKKKANGSPKVVTPKAARKTGDDGEVYVAIVPEDGTPFKIFDDPEKSCEFITSLVSKGCDYEDKSFSSMKEATTFDSSRNITLEQWKKLTKVLLSLLPRMTKIAFGNPLNLPKLLLKPGHTSTPCSVMKQLWTS